MRLVVHACYLLTGAFGLTYEVVWSRYLALLVGNTAYAHAAVLATFMGGLALGAAIFGPLADRLDVAGGLRTYGWLEVGVGLFGALFPAWFGVCEGIADGLYAGLTPGSTSLAMAKLGLAVLCVLPPAVLMGGTLPVLTRVLTGAPRGVRGSVAGLYATNAAGAVVGALVTGFWGIGTLGLPGVVTLVGIINTLLGLGVLLAARRVDVPPAPDRGGEDARSYAPADRRLAVALAAFSGFATMALEVAWIRTGALLLGSAHYAFTLMLAAFVAGIAAGAWVLALPRAARWPLRPLLAGALLATAGALAALLLVYPRLGYLAGSLLRVFAADEAAFPVYQLAVYSFCFVAMCVPAGVAGLVFPATVRLASEAGRVGARLGVVYAANTVGTMLGATLTGLVLFRWIGVEGVFRGALVAYALAAAWVAVGSGRRRLAVLALLVAGLHPVLDAPTDPRLLTEGTYRRGHPLGAEFADFVKLTAENDLISVAEGPHATVTTSLLGAQIVLRVNGKPDASTGADMSTEVLLGHLPVLLHEAPRDVFLLGLGAGVTAGAVLAHDVQLTVAEISEEVVEAERYFAGFNGEPLKDPRTRLVVEDARTVLRAEATRYDVVVSEPTNPWQAGVAGLFTTEFYDLVKTRLRPGGLFAQWMHAYEANDVMVALVVATLNDRFAHVSAFEIGPSDFLFVAGERPLTLDPTRFAARVATVGNDLERVDAERPFVLLATQVESSESLRADFPKAPVNTDENVLLEELSGPAFFAGRNSRVLFRGDERLAARGALLVDQWLRHRPLEGADVDGLARFGRRVASDAMRRSTYRLAREMLGPDHETTRQLRVLAEPLELLEWPHPTKTSDLEALAGLLLTYCERQFVRWAPPPVDRLEALLDTLEVRGRDIAKLRTRYERFRQTTGL